MEETMNKRNFLAAAALAPAVFPSLAQAAEPASGGSPALLTVTGAITKPNRGPLDSVRIS
jgi:hypothetical protein